MRERCNYKPDSQGSTDRQLGLQPVAELAQFLAALESGPVLVVSDLGRVQRLV